MKRKMDQDANSTTRSALEAHLKCFIKVIMDSSDPTTKEMQRSAQEGFIAVRTKLDSIYTIVLRKGREGEAA